tara:strand:- start:1149 stop:2351 length:1203 start_codon:yes stop_codon:yes gene_type:complete
MKCKVSGKKITPFMSFGKMPMANGFLDKEEFKDEFFYELEVGFSEDNFLFQVNDHPKSNKIFNDKYPFYTHKSTYMTNHFRDYFNWIKKNFITNKSKVIEIGSNDGTFLKNFKNNNIEHIGFEPSKNVASLSKQSGINVLNEFFNYKNASNLKNFKKKTDIICAANVICHVPDLVDLIKGIDVLLSRDGIFVFEEPYLGSMLKKISYDQIYDAHVFMFSILSVRKVFQKFDFELIDAHPQITHGGSMRYVVGRKNTKRISPKIESLLREEVNMNMDSLDAYIKFKKKCELSRENFKKKILAYKDQKKRICGYAASAKSSTVLNYSKIGSETIDFIADSTEEKIGKFSPGMHIPIVSIDEFRKQKPDVAILFAWNHKNEILEKEKKFSKEGGIWTSHVSEL